MPKNLVIVESPAKAKTIEKFLGSDFMVKSSFGHIRDLPSKGMSIDIENEFAPDYAVSSDKKRVVSELRKAAKTAETVWLASDEDREGEAIAWHLYEVLKLKPSNTKRIVFHEITKPAITKAVEEPRDINIALVNAQQARRVLDRLVGYELSPVLWKKVRRGLSAGRVQSVAVRLIVEREREIEEFERESSYKITAIFDAGGVELKAELPKKLKTVDEARDFMNDLLAAECKVSSIERKPGTRNPSPPFTTSTLQQAASQRLGYSVKQTMMLAQRLYEAGHITYMRTDSVNLSQIARAAAEKHITSAFGADYAQSRAFKTKSSGAQEAHEAIRPTDVTREGAGADAQQKKLYSLIRSRTLASQMAPAKLEKTTATVTLSNRDDNLTAKGEVITFEGFLAAYSSESDKKQHKLPDISEGQELTLLSADGTETLSRPPARYTEASLVKKLEEMGIGRPSTYAPTISTVQDRGYIEKADVTGTMREMHHLSIAGADDGSKLALTETKAEEEIGSDRNKLVPTDIAGVVTDFLVKNFPEVIDFDFTANVEGKFDTIAAGDLKWQQMIGDFYKDFHPLIEKSDGISRAEASQARVLGVDPKSGKPVSARFGRFGPMLQIGTAEDEEKPKFAPMPAGAKIDTITLEEGLEMFKLPRSVGETKDGKAIEANIGRFGPYIKIDGKFISIKPLDPFTITLDEALEKIAEAAEKEKNKYIQRFDGVDILNGRYGPYITDGKKNAPVPKDSDPKTITLEEAKEILAKKKPGRAPRKKR